MQTGKGVVFVTGSNGLIASELVARLAADYTVIGSDQPGQPDTGKPDYYFPMDLTSDDSVDAGIGEIRKKCGRRIDAVVHLAAYYSFTGGADPRYRNVNVLGTERLLRHLQALDVGRFVFSSSMLVHAPTEPGRPIREDSPLAPAWAYPKSKHDAEECIRGVHGKIPYAIARIAGVYDNRGGLPALAQQIQRIYERKPTGRLFPGNIRHGQSAIHLDDVVALLAALIEKSRDLPDELVLLAGEPETVSYATLQSEIGKLIHGKPWKTWKIPKFVARNGARLQEVALPKSKEPFIKHWMIDLADDHYELDIGKAGTRLGWEPRHRLLKTLPHIVAALKADPGGWYRHNKLGRPPK